MRKIIKNTNTRQTNTFRLHYFPNIPTRRPASSPQAPIAADIDGDVSSPERPVGEKTGHTEGRRRDGETKGVLPDDRTQLEAMVKQAYAEGFAQGERDARALGAERIDPLVTTLKNMTTELATMRQKLQTQIEKEVVELALQIGRKVIGQELQTNRSAVAAIVREALKRVEDPEKICIRMNPADIQHLERAKIDIDCPGTHGDCIRYQEDRSIEIGGCLVQTEYGEIDARIEEQLRAIEEAFRAESMCLAEDE